MWYSTVGGIVMLTLSLLVASCAAHARPAKTMPRIGVLLGSTRSPSAGVPQWQAGGTVASFLDALRALGYLEGQTIALTYRWGQTILSDRSPLLQSWLHSQWTCSSCIAGLQRRLPSR